MSYGLTFDTGMLIAIERRRLRPRTVFQVARDARKTITVPSAVVTEWWRGRTDVRVELLASLSIEPLSDALARIAGEALANVDGATAIDAIVMASAAQRGDVVYTSDIDDLERLRVYFPGVRVLGTG